MKGPTFFCFGCQRPRPLASKIIQRGRAKCPVCIEAARLRSDKPRMRKAA